MTILRYFKIFSESVETFERHKYQFAVFNHIYIYNWDNKEIALVIFFLPRQVRSECVLCILGIRMSRIMYIQKTHTDPQHVLLWELLDLSVKRCLDHMEIMGEAQGFIFNHTFSVWWGQTQTFINLSRKQSVSTMQLIDGH